jgi:hypothetical protein
VLSAALALAPAVLELLVVLVLELLDPHAASSSASPVTSAALATNLIDLIKTPPVFVYR